MAQAYPILLDVADRLIVIVGGGSVAARKAAGVLAAGALRVRCVSPVFCDDLPAGVERIASSYAIQHLAGAGLVFAATDRRDVNDAVVNDARRMGILVNRADSDEALPGDFSTPAMLTAGKVTVTVSASSPALSAALRDDLQAKLDQRFVAMADAMQTLRPLIRSADAPQARRAQIFRDLAGDEALNCLAQGGIEALTAWLYGRYAELKHG